MATRTRPYTPWYKADYARAAIPAGMIEKDFERRHLMRVWQGIPSLEVTDAKTIYAAWYSGGQTEGPDNFVLLARKRPGADWELPYRIVECAEGVRVFDPSLWIDPSGKLHLFWAQGSLFFDGKDGVWESVCANPDALEPSWSAPRRLCDGLMLNKPTVLSDGRWLYTVARSGLRRFHGIPAATVIGSENDPLETRAQVWVSEDGGQTVSLLSEVRDTRTDFGEHMLYEKRDGSLVLLLRASPALIKYTSRDGGKSWQDEGESKIPSPCSRFHIRRLTSGRLLLVNHISADARDRLCAFLSGDDGQTWSAPLMLDARDLVSYPDAKQTPDGQIYIVYDRNRYETLEILYARVTEADILAGRIATDGSFLQSAIDKV